MSNTVKVYKCLSGMFLNHSITKDEFFRHVCPNACDDKNGRFGERAPQLTMLAKLVILAIFCQFLQINSFIGIDTRWVNTGDFGEFDKIDNFGDLLPISSN